MKTKSSRWIRWLIVAAMCAAPIAASATSMQLDAKVTRTLATGDASFGGCMAWLTVSPFAQGMDCNTGSWVTFSCSGEHTSKASATRMFDSAQMAYVLERNVRVTVTDEKKHGGWCMATRIDVLSTQ